MSEAGGLSCDVLVAGSGAGALTGALAAAKAGLRTVVAEKTEWFGGTTAYSGGGIWVPANPVLLRAGVRDSVDDGRRYLRATVGERTSASLQEGFLAGGPEMIGFLESDEHLAFSVMTGYPDYHPELPGGIPTGRTISADPLPEEDLGELGRRVRPPLKVGMGGPSFEIPAHLRLPLTGGQALLGRLLLALRAAGAELRTDCGLVELATSPDGAVTGAVVSDGDGRRRRIEVGTGILLAAGGFERSGGRRRQLGNAVERGDWTLGSPGNTGDALIAAVDIGAATDLLDDCWWAPGLVRPDGQVSFVLFERAAPGGIIVNGAGRRYANEALPYNAFGHAMLEGERGGVTHIPSWFVTDQQFMDDHGFGGLPPRTRVPDEWRQAGVAHTAPTLAGLGEAIGVPGAALDETVRRFNQFATNGVDEDFGRGSSAYDRNLLAFFRTLPGVRVEPGAPNPVMRPVGPGPYHAMRLVLSDLGTKGGLVCTADAQVVRQDGSPIPGLYAAGNTMASVMGHAYPGPGACIAPSMTFGYLAGRHMAGVAAAR